MFNVSQNGTKLSGYFFNIVNHIGYYHYNDPTEALHSLCGPYPGTGTTSGDYSKGRYGFQLWKLKDVNFDCTWYGDWHCGASGSAGGFNSTNEVSLSGGGTIKCLAQWYVDRDPGYYNTYHLTYENGTIRLTIKERNKSIIGTDYSKDGSAHEYTRILINDLNNADTNIYKVGTYGFWGNNCERETGMVITDFIARVEQKKNYGDILNNAKWRENAIKCVVNINKEKEEGLKEASVITQTLNNNINFLQWSSIINKLFNDEFIKLIDNQGNNMYYRKEDMIEP